MIVDVRYNTETMTRDNVMGLPEEAAKNILWLLLEEKRANSIYALSIEEQNMKMMKEQTAGMTTEEVAIAVKREQQRQMNMLNDDKTKKSKKPKSKKTPSDTYCKYTAVYKSGNKYKAMDRITEDGKQTSKYIGMFDDPIEAALAVDKLRDEVSHNGARNRDKFPEIMEAYSRTEPPLNGSKDEQETNDEGIVDKEAQIGDMEPIWSHPERKLSLVDGIV